MATRLADRYPLRAQFAGMLYWTCPNCAHLNRTRLVPGRWAIRCKVAECGRVAILGLLFYQPRPGQKPDRPGDPPDAIITEPYPPDHSDSEPTPNPEPMPNALPQGPRKAFTPVHRTEPLPD